MDFELGNRQKQIRLAVREFAEAELAPIGKECEAKGEFPRDIIKKAGQLGFIGVFIKKDYGGLGLALWKIRSSMRNSGGQTPDWDRYFPRPRLVRKSWSSLVRRSRRRSTCRPWSKGSG